MLVDMIDRINEPRRIDIVDDESFRDVYGMLPWQFAEEVHAGRIVPIINAEDPLSAFRDRYYEVVLPILRSVRDDSPVVQLAALRTAAFQNWFYEGDFENLLKDGRRIAADYFVCHDDGERELLCTQLRANYQNPDAAAKIVAGRWRNIVSLSPSLATPLEQALHGLRDQPAVKRAEVLNGVKNLVSSPISAGRGGVFRASPQAIDEITKLRDHVALSETLFELVELFTSPDPWTAEALIALERSYVLPGVRVLDYPSYRRLVDDARWEEFSEGISGFVMSLLDKTPAHARPETLKEVWERVVGDYNAAMAQYDAVDEAAPWVLPLATISAPPYADKVIASFVTWLPGVHPQSSPGTMLAQLAWRARRRKWPPSLL